VIAAQTDAADGTVEFPPTRWPRSTGNLFSGAWRLSVMFRASSMSDPPGAWGIAKLPGAMLRRMRTPRTRKGR
jgi:hypothetical protein